MGTTTTRMARAVPRTDLSQPWFLCGNHAAAADPPPWVLCSDLFVLICCFVLLLYLSFLHTYVQKMPCPYLLVIELHAKCCLAMHSLGS